MELRAFERVIVRGHEIPLQLFCSRSDRLEPGMVEAVVNVEGLPFKPAGGLWTSTFICNSPHHYVILPSMVAIEELTYLIPYRTQK